MRWTPGIKAVLTTAVVLALVALVVTYVVGAGAEQQPVIRAVPSTSGAPSPTSPATPAPRSHRPSTGSPSAAPRSATPTLVVPAPRATQSPGALPRRLRPPTPRLRPSEEPLPALEFTLSSFNVLGASHTAGRDARPGYASGTVRARRAAMLLDRHRADVIGFQELQVSQLRTLRRSTDLDFYPGLALGPRNAENSIGWRRGQWAAVERRTVNIPYFNGGARAMPVVRLRSRSTGLEAWFANFHNPAETRQFHRQQRFRTRATLIEASLANQLLTTTGLPVFITGDMNERAAYFCRLTSRAPMVAARGGTNIGRCLAGRPPQVDWIFGSQGVQFTEYVEDRSPFVDRTSDHPMVSARVRIEGKPVDASTGD